MHRGAEPGCDIGSPRLRPAGRTRGLALLLAHAFGSCATGSLPPPEAVSRQARVAPSYSARVRVRFKGPEVRLRASVLVAFERPDALRIEVPGPTGARLLAVARRGSLVAVFPAERAVFRGAATEADLEALFGIALAPEEVMDLLVGVASPRLRDYQARWGSSLPARIEATLPDGGRLQLVVEDPDTRALPPAAFEEPAYDAYRAIDAAEARNLWGRR